ncbi:hypothetical protein U1Q18_033698 [Sarracenia purpurea var. burkii]
MCLSTAYFKKMDLNGLVGRGFGTLIGLSKIRKNELGSAQDLSLQRHLWAVHVGLVGAVSLQYPPLD